MKQEIKKIVTNISFRFILAVLLLVSAVVLFVFIAHWTVIEQEDAFDQWIFDTLASYTNQRNIEIMAFLTFFGRPHFLVPAYMLLISFFSFKRQRQHALNIFIIAVTSTGLLFGLKYIFQRERPNYPVLQTLGGFSFPSGHAFLFFVFCSIFIYFLAHGKWARPWKWVLSSFLIGFSIAVGFSRIFLRYHFASDVIAGFCVGYTYVFSYLWIQERKK